MGSSARLRTAVRYADVALLVVALPVFLAAGLPLAGYAAVAAFWGLSLWLEAYAERRAAGELAEGNRRDAMGWVAVTTLARVWVIALAVLLVGLLFERDAGLAAAVFAAVLFTVHFGCRFIARAMTPREERLG